MARLLEPKRIFVQEAEVTYPVTADSVRAQSIDGDDDQEIYSGGEETAETQDKFSFQAMNKEIELCVEETRIIYSENDQYGRKEYIGPVINGKRHGEGTLVYRNNDRCEAIFEAGALVEPTRFVKADPDRRPPRAQRRPRIARVWYNDCPDGCQEYVGPLVGGQRHGHGLLRYHRDGLAGRFEGGFHRGRLAFGTVHWEDGAAYTGEFKDFLPCGNGQKTYPDRSTYVGQWWNGLRNGHGKVSYPNGDALECTFVSDLPMGQGVYTWAVQEGAAAAAGDHGGGGGRGRPRRLSGTFTEFGTPAACTASATVFWWVGALTAAGLFLFLNVWHGAPCNSASTADAATLLAGTGSSVSMGGGIDILGVSLGGASTDEGAGQHRCVALGFDGGWTLHITHWWLYYNASLGGGGGGAGAAAGSVAAGGAAAAAAGGGGGAALGARAAHVFVTGVPLLMDLFVGVVFVMDLWTYCLRILLALEPYSLLHQQLANLVFYPAASIYTNHVDWLERIGCKTEKSQWSAALYFGQLCSGTVTILSVCFLSILPHLYYLYVM